VYAQIHQHEVFLLGQDFSDDAGFILSTMTSASGAPPGQEESDNGDAREHEQTIGARNRHDKRRVTGTQVLADFRR